MNESTQSEIVAVAQAILEGQIDMILGCRQLNGLRFQIDKPVPPTFKIILAFESQTDEYPIGESRSLYNKSLLDRGEGRGKRPHGGARFARTGDIR